MHKLRDDLPPLTERIARLPIDERGYPVPAFVQWIIKDGNEVEPAAPGKPGAYPDFRIVDPDHMLHCIRESACWVCGDKLGVFRSYVIGPMCSVNHTSAEPPSHRECAEWSVKGCPFLTKPHMKRREDELIEKSMGNVAGHMVKRNPGVSLIWTVRNQLKFWNDGNGGILFDIGNPIGVSWWKEGRKATTDECVEALNGSIEALLEVCETDEERNEVASKRDMIVQSLKEVPHKPPPPTYPARPMNGGRLEMAEPLDMEQWRYRPKYNGRRVLLHVPTGRTWNRQLEENSWVFPSFKKLRDIIETQNNDLTVHSDVWEACTRMEWLDIELLYGKTSVAKRSLVVLDYISQNEIWWDRMVNLNAVFGEQMLLTNGEPMPDEVYFARPLTEMMEPQLVWEEMQEQNKAMGCTFYEGLVAYDIRSKYPIQLFSPTRETRHWIKYRFIN